MNKNRKFNLIDRKELKNQSKTIRRIEDNKPVEVIKSKRTTYFSTLEVILIMILSILFGSVIGVIFSLTKYNYLDSSDKNLQEFISTYNSIVNNYYNKVNKDELIDSAINGMVNSLDDPYSTYMNENETDDFNDSISGYYDGVGITITVDGDNIKIIDIIHDSPADKAGMKKGDIIVKVNGINITKDNFNIMRDTISSADNKKIKFLVNRDGNEITFNIKKDRIVIDSVFSDIKDNNIGYLEITSFYANTGDQFEKKLNELEKENISSLIIDLRDNPGGHLNQVNRVVEPFFKKGVVIYQVESNNKKTKIKTTKKDSRKYPVVILINENTASAAEIVAACFDDNYSDITLIGKKTYGKGTIQKEVNLNSGSSYKYTTDRWLTSKGKWLNRGTTGGLDPDIDIERYDLNDLNNTDLQLQKAISILNEKNS
ncbi:MAG: S41 family peptidase [Bacilli bacterium]|nr:S41 family peptidase [Bacilli bacterium]